MLQPSRGHKYAQIHGIVKEGIAKDFIREFLPIGFCLKSGLVLDSENGRISPQIDAIIYKGAPLLEFSDLAIVEKEQVKGIFEIKGQLNRGDIFGSSLSRYYDKRKDFLPSEARYILFAFELRCSESDNEVHNKLGELCDYYAVVIRREPLIERKQGKQPRVVNFNNSISALIEWLRSLE